MIQKQQAVKLIEYMKNKLLSSPKKIIVRMPNWLGDAVMATPLLEDLRNKFPSAFITVMAIDKVAPLFQKDERINEVFSFSKPSGSLFLRRKEGKNIIATINAGKYDTGILLTNSFSSAWWFYRGNIQIKVGFKSDFRNCMLNVKVPFPKKRKEMHLVDTYKMLLRPFGIINSTSRPTLFIGCDEVNEAKARLSLLGFKEDMNLIGINSSAAYGPAKCWPEENFRELLEKLLEDEKNFIIFFGDAKSYDLNQNITHGFNQRLANLAGMTTLRQLMAMISVVDVFITNDSGPMHIAAALKRPLVALFGSTDDKVTGPYNTGIVIHKRVECSPCFKRVCPIDFRCMKRIKSQEVFEEVNRLLRIKRG